MHKKAQTESTVPGFFIHNQTLCLVVVEHRTFCRLLLHGVIVL